MGNLRVEHATKRYSEVVAVEDMNLDIEDGEFVTLVGPSGCGKSTTLEMIAGLTRPSEGDIYITERNVTDLPPKDRNIAMVFQNIALFPHLNVYDNISYGLKIHNYNEEEIDRRVNRAVEILQLGGMPNRMPSELSGGQRQRVAIGRAIVREPDVFLMDEPLANLDAKLRVHMRTEIQRIQRELDVTTVYVTHDQEEAMTMSDRIAILNQGTLQQIAPPLECYDTPANVFVAGFIGSPSMNFLDGSIENGTFDVGAFPASIEVPQLPESAGGDPVTVGIRPEDIYLAEGSGSVTDRSMTLPATVDVLEPLGDEIFVYLIPPSNSTGSEQGQAPEGTEEMIRQANQLLMSVTRDNDVEEGQEVRVKFDKQNIHIFDKGSGDALLHGVELVSDTAVEPS